jgi:hypothetical protein
MVYASGIDHKVVQLRLVTESENKYGDGKNPPDAVILLSSATSHRLARIAKTAGVWLSAAPTSWRLSTNRC